MLIDRLVLLFLFLFLMQDNKLFKEIANRTSRAQLFYTNASNLVTSYHSFRSKFHRQNDWFLRLWLHQDLNPGLRAYLCTFTYRPECHPIYNVRTHVFGRGYFPSPFHHDGVTREKRFDPDTIPLFCKVDKTLFFKKLRKRLGESVKYLWCSEFGKRFTKRAHYHSIIFVDASISPSDALRALRESWTYVVRYEIRDNLRYPITKSLGNVDIACGRDGLPWVHNAEGFRYASKYITKDTYLDEDERYTSLSDDEKERVKPYLPYKASSINLGVNWWDKYDSSALFDGIPVPVLLNGQRVIKYYPLPSVCIDRYFFNHHYIKGVRRPTASIVSDVQFRAMLNFHFYRRLLSSFEYHSYMDLVHDDLCKPVDIKFLSRFIRVVPNILLDYYHKKNECIHHIKFLRADRLELYKKYTSHVLTVTAKRWALLTGFSFDSCLRCLLWSRVRSSIIPLSSPLLSVPFSNDDLLKFLYFKLSGVNDLRPCFGFDGVKEMLSHPNSILAMNPNLQDCEQNLLLIYELMLKRSESLIKVFREREENAKFARESFGLTHSYEPNLLSYV